jgi:mRNA-degrading endonuclease RelE of RelBE toxin-antitoxin system
MSFALIFRETALRSLAGLRREDKDLFVQARRSIEGLADEPYPEGAVAWGGSGVYRLHSGGIRILYEVDAETATVHVINVGIAG